ncbi:hypothetical protein [Streptomyces werraensis]|uniref:hypothetical protein n=1 Tax=Streptomyces werraensis TaxID=68284 RepID=UPI0034474A79
MNAVVNGLRTLNGHGLRDLAITEMPVCGDPENRGELTEEEYAPYVAAADETHTNYMRWSHFLVPPQCLHSTVSVSQTVVAWIQYDGVVRVIDRLFSKPHMNTIRDLAREHLGQDPEVQQRLANQRGEIGAMNAEGFRNTIWVYKRRAAPGSKTNDYPPGMSARAWDHANRRENTGPDKQTRPWIWPMNPTRELTEQERAHWAKEAQRYADAFRDRFPDDFRRWDFRNWWEATRADRARRAPLGLKADERVLVELWDQVLPAVVSWPGHRRTASTETVDLAVKPGPGIPDQDGYLPWVNLYAGRVLRYEDVPEQWRGDWDETWELLVKQVQAHYADAAYSIRYDD